MNVRGYLRGYRSRDPEHKRTVTATDFLSRRPSEGTGGTRTNYMPDSDTVMIPNKIYDTALIAPHDVIDRVILPSIRLSGASWWGDPPAMGTNRQSDSDSPDTDTRIDTNSSAVDRPNESVNTLPPALASNTTDHHGQPRFFDLDSEGTDNDLDGFVAAVATIAQSQCERATDYADIETLVCRLPIDRCTFAAHDALAPYSGPYPMALLVRRAAHFQYLVQIDNVILC